jgi:hypothetical protein
MMKRFAKEDAPNLDDILGSGWRAKTPPGDNYETAAFNYRDGLLAAQKKPDIVAGAEATRADIHPNPSDAQIEAENYKKGHPGRFAGHDVSLETAKGGTRRSKEGVEPAWEQKDYPTDYGHLLRTTGADGDPLDIGFAGTGDKHYVIDQKDPETGKFDEHKIIAHAKSGSDAADHYLRGFDETGPQRLAGIKEFSEEGIQKWANLLANQPALRRAPVSAALAHRLPEKITAPDVGVAKTKIAAKDRVAIQENIQKLRAQGNEEGAAKLEAIVPGSKEDIAAAKVRRRLYGENGNWPVKGVPGASANTEGLAATRAATHNKIADWFEETKPPSQLPAEKETNGELLSRLGEHPFPAKGEWVPRSQPKEWMLAKQAKDLLAKPTRGQFEKYRSAEQLLRGDDASVDTYRSGKGIEGGIAKSRRSGDDAIAGAEAKTAKEGGQNNIEDAYAEALDAKKAEATKALTARDTAEGETDSKSQVKEIKGAADLEDVTPAAHNAENFTAKPEKTLDVENPADRAEMAKVLNTEPVPEWKRLMAERTAKLKEKQADLKQQVADRQAAKDAAQAAHTDDLLKTNHAKLSKADMAKYTEMGNKNKVDPKLAAKVRDASAKARIIADEHNLGPEEKANFIEAAVKRAHDLFDAKAKPTETVASLMEDFRKNTDAAGHPERVVDTLKKLYEHLKTWDVRTYGKGHTWNALQTMKNSVRDAYNQSVSDDFKTMQTLKLQDDGATRHWLQELANRNYTPALLKKLFTARDENKISSLSLYEQVKYAPLKEKLDGLEARYKMVRELDPSLPAPVDNHITHLLKGIEDYDPLLPGSSDDPIEGFNNVSISAKGSNMDRKFAVLERDSDGKRYVIAKGNDGPTVWDKYHGTKWKDPDFTFKAGEKYQAGPNTYTMKDVHVSEVEANVHGVDHKPLEYHKNIAFSLAYAEMHINDLTRNIMFVRSQAANMIGKGLATYNSKTAEIKGFEKTNLPVFNSAKEGTLYVEPRLKEVIDHYANPSLWPDGYNKWRVLSSVMVKSIFWNPVIHIANAGVHFVTSRGVDNLNAASYLRWGEAMKSVIAQDHPVNEEILRNGGSLMLPGTLHKNTVQTFGKLAGEMIKNKPADWDLLANKFGITKPGEIIKAVYDNSAKILWAGNDMMYTSLYLDAKAKGMSARDAVNFVEKGFPNYRIPPRIFGSKALAKILGTRELVAFGPYHTGIGNAYANNYKDLVHGSATDRFDAVGQLATLALLGTVAWPYANEFAKKVTGNEHATMTPRGALTLPFIIAKVAQGEADISAPMRSMISFSPFLNTAKELYDNKDFSHNSIWEEGDMANAFAGHPRSAGRVAARVSGYAAQQMFSPLNTFGHGAKNGEAPWQTLADQMLGIHNPSPSAIKRAALSPKRIQQQSVSAQKHGGRNILETGFNKVFGAGK